MTLLLLTQLLFAQTLTPRYQALSPHTPAFYEYLPQGYSTSGSQTYPLILSFHGAGNIGNGTAAQLPRVLEAGIPRLIHEGNFPTLVMSGGQAHRFIVLAPQFSSWPDAHAVRSSIDAILDYAVQQYRVNRQRIYLTGLSMGGGFAFDYVGSSNSRAMRIAAMVPIAEASQPVYSQARTIASANLPVWATHNYGDPNVPVAQTEQYVTWINESPSPNPQAKKSIFWSNIHDAWTQTYNPSFSENGMNIYQWMLQFQRVLTAAPNVADSSAEINLFPVPAGANVEIRWMGKERGNFTARIYSGGGNLVRQWQDRKPNEQWQHQLRLDALPAGSYFLELEGKGFKRTKRFTKL